MWKKVSKEVLDKAQYIVPLKKGELQIKYAETLVKIDKAIEYINKFKDSPEYIDAYDITYWQEEVLAILEDKEV